MSPKAQAIAYRLWAYATPRGWDCTVTEAADALGVTRQAIAAVARCKGWGERFRSSTTHSIDMTVQSGMMHGFDDMVTL